MVRVTWLLHRGGFLGMLGLYAACAAAIVIGSQPARSTFSTYVADGCVTRPLHAPCGTLANVFATTTDPLSAILIALSILPVIVGAFLGAPLVARQVESGTYRFAFTQGLDRTRQVLTALVLLAVFVVVGAVVLGLLLSTWAHPFEVVGDKSPWQAGQFDTTWVMLAGWSVLGLAVGTLVGTLTKRTVAAMAGTTVVVGGLVVAATVSFVRFVVSIAPAASNGFAPNGLGIGALDMQSHYGQGPPGAWLLTSWMTGPHGRVLGTLQAWRLYTEVYTKGAGPRSLSLHHVSFWVSFQPAGHYWIFQVVTGLVLVLLAVIMAMVVLRRLRRLA